MSKFNTLVNIILNEAPISAYAKSLGRAAVSPTSWLKGTGKVLSGAQKAAGAFTTSTGGALAKSLGSGANIAQGAAGALKSTQQWLKNPNKKEWWDTEPEKFKDKIPVRGDTLNITLQNRKINGKITKTNERNKIFTYRVNFLNKIPGADNMILTLSAGKQPLATMMKGQQPIGKSTPIQVTPTDNKRVWNITL